MSIVYFINIHIFYLLVIPTEAERPQGVRLSGGISALLSRAMRIREFYQALGSDMILLSGTKENSPESRGGADIYAVGPRFLVHYRRTLIAEIDPLKSRSTAVDRD